MQPNIPIVFQNQKTRARNARVSPIIASTQTVLGLVLAFCAINSNKAVQADTTPNIIFILADDMGIGDVSHNGGLAPTPHIDQLAAGGMRFTDAHTTSSVCTPTRYSILTGRYNWRSTLKKSVLYGLGEPLIPHDRTTVAGLLGDRGYRTGVVGKWHLGLGWQKMPEGEVFSGTPEAERSKNHTRLEKIGWTIDCNQPFQGGPTQLGFDSSFIIGLGWQKMPEGEVFSGTPEAERSKNHTRLEEIGWTIDYNQPVQGGPTQLGFDSSFIIPASLDMYPYVYLKNDQVVQVPTTMKAFNRAGAAGADFEAVNCLRDFARESREFIASESDKPFFLYLPLSSPHTPIVPSGTWEGKSNLSKYGDFVMETDWVVGEVLDELKKQGIADNTLVLFTTDNGCSPRAEIAELQAKGHSPNGNLRGHKADIFDGGHRVPLIVRWPGVVEAGAHSDQLVSTVDFTATVADMVGAVDKIDGNTAEDSFSFLPILKGTDEPIRPFLIHHSINGSFAIRSGKWKLNLCPGSGGWSTPQPEKALEDKSLPLVQLYDLEADIAESNNLIEAQPQIADSLVDKLAAAITNGRTTPGEQVSNDGWPRTINKRIIERYPALAEPKCSQ